MQRITGAAGDAALDLGAVGGPLFVFGWPYSNLAATSRVLEIADSLDIPPDRTVCTGDVVAYCAHPVETITAIRRAGVHVVRGNCEESLGQRLDDCGCGFADGSACDLMSKTWFDYASQTITEDHRAWLGSRPRRIDARMAGRRLTFVHGHSADISGWVFASTPKAELIGHVEALNTDIVVGGHCGLPFAVPLGNGRAWVNAGVVGMPANDGTPRGWYAALRPANGDTAIDIEIKAFDYDYAGEIEEMRSRGLPAGYRDALGSGLWPNMDVLPPLERAARGTPLPAERRVSLSAA